MSAEGARIIDLDEYRRRRVQRNEHPTSTVVTPPPIVWVPVWLWVPVWPIA